MKPIETPKDNVILVPTDFSSSAFNALEHAVQMAKLFNNKITLLHIIENTGFLASFFGSNQTQKDLMMDGIHAKMEEMAKVIKSDHPEIDVDFKVKEGKTYKMINEAVEELPVDSIVMGTNGASGIEQFIGSTASRIIRSAAVPVVVVKDGRKDPTYDRIILPIDLTKESRQKVKWGIHLAKKYNSEIHVIMEFEGDEFLMNKVKASLNQVEHILAENGVKYETKILDDQEYPDDFGKDIIQYAEKIDADLILIMTQQERGMSEIFLGSYAQQIVNSAQKTPVMCINPKQVGTWSGSDGFY